MTVPAHRLTATAFVIALLGGCGPGEDARHEVSVPWSLSGQSLVADLHSHTTFSDGNLDPHDLVRKALANGCEVLAITDHGAPQTKSATPEYFTAIRELREKYSRLILFGGLEWNIPPYKGKEHVGVLLDPGVEAQVLPEFKRMFDMRDDVAAAEAFRWLQGKLKEPVQAVLILHHPTRQPSRSPEQVLKDFAAWRAATPLMVGFEGGPGHQKNTYARKAPNEHRWDVVASKVGGTWDTLLDSGLSVWAAQASSDYHGYGDDYLPCAFSRTFIQVPERSYAGVLKALHAGSFWGVHGRMLRWLLFTVSAPGLKLPAAPGETIAYRAGKQVQVRVALERDPEAEVSPLSAEIIGNCRSGKPEIIASLALDSSTQEVETSVPGLRPGADKASCYLRLRIRKQRQDGDDWLAYSNPVRIRLQ